MKLQNLKTKTPIVITAFAAIAMPLLISTGCEDAAPPEAQPTPTTSDSATSPQTLEPQPIPTAPNNHGHEH